MNNESLQKGIENFLSDTKSKSHLVFDHTVFVCRNDGLVLYFHTKDQNINKNSIGALVGGLWQAGKTVVDIFGRETNPTSYRLSFDTSESGLHILPFEVNGTEYFMGLHFSEMLNPGMVKNKMKILMNKMKESFEAYKDQPIEKVPEKELFSNITDEEIDTLFSFAEN